MAIKVLALSGFPDEVLQEFQETMSKTPLQVDVSRRESAPFAAFEWTVPSIVMVGIAMPFISGLVGEAGKDTYLLLKKSLGRLAYRVLENPKFGIITASGPRKNEGLSRRSIGFSVGVTVFKGCDVRFLFPEGRDRDFYNCALDELFEVVRVLSEHEEEWTVQNMPNHQVYFEYLDQWTAIDVEAEIASKVEAQRKSANGHGQK